MSGIVQSRSHPKPRRTNLIITIHTPSHTQPCYQQSCAPSSPDRPLRLPHPVASGPIPRRLDHAPTPFPHRPKPLLCRQPRSRLLPHHHPCRRHSHQLQPGHLASTNPPQRRAVRLPLLRHQNPPYQPRPLRPRLRQRRHPQTNPCKTHGHGRRRLQHRNWRPHRLRALHTLACRQRRSYPPRRQYRQTRWYHPDGA